MPAARAVTLVAACAALSGCGAAVSDERERLHSTVEAFRLACAREDALAVVGTLSPPDRALFVDEPSTLDGCARIAGLEIDAELDVKAALEQAEVTAITVRGDTASAVLATPEGYDDGVLELDSTGLQWRLHAAVEQR